MELSIELENIDNLSAEECINLRSKLYSLVDSSSGYMAFFLKKINQRLFQLNYELGQDLQDFNEINGIC